MPCRDQHGRRAHLEIGIAPDGVRLTPTVQGSLTLTESAVGQLRAAMREAVCERAPLAVAGARYRRRRGENPPVFGAFFHADPKSWREVDRVPVPVAAERTHENPNVPFGQRARHRRVGVLRSNKAA